MGKIATYVFLDLTTNAQAARFQGEIKIGELCMIAVKRKHIELRLEEPRTQNELRMCWLYYLLDETYVRRIGLSEYDLKTEGYFNGDTFNVINSFISCLEKPVCMIAHDGFKLHYPLLKYYYDRFKAPLPNTDLLCTDSIYAFYDIVEQENNEGTKNVRSKHNKPGVKLYKNIVRETFYNVKPKESYEIGDIYSRMINGDLTPQNAENRCHMIMKLAIKESDAFVAWVERNHCRFSEVPML